MEYFNQVIAVTRWEFQRFFKPKNEILGIVIMLLVSAVFYFGSKYALSESVEKPELKVFLDLDSRLIDLLSENFELKILLAEQKEAALEDILQNKSGSLLISDGQGFTLHAYKKSRELKLLRSKLDEYNRILAMEKMGLNPGDLAYILTPAHITVSYIYNANSKNRVLLAYIFAGLMILAVFLSFAYQFTAITGEKQLKITELIVSAIKPQVWMDGKIYGITLTGLSSMFTYSMIGIIGGILYFQFTGIPISVILDYIYLPSILLYIPYALIGILIWNAILAAIASVITDPNNSGKSSLMMLPLLFVFASFLVIRDPDNKLAIFLSWFPLTSASSMPIRWAITEVELWQLTGSFILLLATFYFFRKVAAKVFRVSILITGKEPTWREIIKLSRES